MIDRLVFSSAVAGYLFKGKFRLAEGHHPRGGHQVPEDFPAICVASMADPASDSQIIDYLHGLGIGQVRLDYSYASPDDHTARFLERLLGDDFRVLLRLVPPPAEARQMLTGEGQERWRQFVVAALDRFGNRVEAVEVGNTVNRRSWSGYETLEHFMVAWTIAYHELRRRNIVVAGPNVSDFEPPLNAGFLSVMTRHGTLPDIHTDNLFAERAIEPEFFDHKVLGRRLAPLHKLNLVKKARLLAGLSDHYAVGKTWSTTAFWTIKRIARRIVASEEKQADYIARYMVLAAASGGLDRAYWGPLVSQREGLVDDGTGKEAELELVAYYGSNNGRLEDYRVRPAFHAFACFSRLIPGSRYVGKCTAAQALQVHEFERGEHRLHALWTTNTRVAELRALYSAADLEAAECLSRDGQLIEDIPDLVTESPLYLRWPLSRRVAVAGDVDVFPNVRVDGNRAGGRYFNYRDAQWRGLVFAADREQADQLIAALHPDRLAPPEKPAVLRKSRNIIWTLPDPRQPGRLLAAKKPHRLRLNKKVNDYFKPSKGLRSWNGACQLLRFGLASPLPVAYFERAEGKDTLNNWYICEYAGDVPSVRDFFSAFARGETTWLGIARKDFFARLSAFLLRLHGAGTYFRDLTGGNILVHIETDGQLSFSLIDTGRTRFFNTSTPLAKRLSDLKRTCYKLDWPGRVEFMTLYLQGLDRRFHAINRLPFHLFDFKMNFKRLIKGKKRVAANAGLIGSLPLCNDLVSLTARLLT